MHKILLNGNWKTKGYEHCSEMPVAMNHDINGGEWIPATVPGDIHKDLERVGIISDPYYGDNYLQCQWVTEKDWCYIKEFEIPVGFLKKHTYLYFEGIDTYADIYLNGKRIESCDNMFLRYEIDISGAVREGTNLLAVYIKSIKNIAGQYPTEGYFACFNTPRIFIRKVQCHFSWDWAPDFPATGIWNDVYIDTRDETFIDNLAVRTSVDGSISFFTNLHKQTYNIDEDAPRYLVLEIEDREDKWTYREEVTGIRNLLNVKIDNPKLWWPVDMGEPYLYNYSITLYQNNIPVDSKKGKFGIREVELEQKPRWDEGGLTCQLKVNNKPVFLKGANWVPLDIMTGTISDDKYKKAINLAAKGNFNTLRVWGGALYEKEIFYNLCDELGIMVWQDLAFACADIPDDYPGFMDSIVPEIEYQVKRLCSHPSLVLWSGGNEKTGSYGKMKSRGDRAIYYMARGIIGHLDPTRPYFPSSPWSYSDLGNDHMSGDTHCNSYQSSMNGIGLNRFRETLASFKTPMASEIAVQGCAPLSSLKKYIPEDKMWPVNKTWDNHFTRNPYDSTGTTFIQQQMEAAEELFGEYDNVYDFIKKSMAVHSEFVKADVEYHRSRKGNCSGSMMWMFSDVWPCGTWALVDYYLEPKASYYAAMRAFNPVQPLITRNSEGICAYIVNDTLNKARGFVEVGQATVDGKILSTEVIENFECGSCESMKVYTFNDIHPAADYIYIHLNIDGEIIRNTFFHKLWNDIKWADPDLDISIKEVEKDFSYTITIKAECYARMVRVVVPQQDKVCLTDNYFDMEGGETKMIVLTSSVPIKEENIKVYSWLDKWEI